MTNYTTKVLAVIGVISMLNIAYEFMQKSDLSKILTATSSKRVPVRVRATNATVQDLERSKNKLLASSSKRQRINVKNTTASMVTTVNATDACDPERFLVLIKAGAKHQYQERRVIWRNSTCPQSYNKHNIKYKFMLAMPAHEVINPNSHNQGARASGAEIEDMKKLRNESLEYADMHFLSMKDVYSEFSYKTLRILEWAVDRGMTSETSIVVLHDDEFCIRPRVLQNICKDANASNSSLYAGNYLWDKAAFEIQKGFDGSFAPYFSGHMYALSSDLVRGIVFDQKSVFTSENVNYSEDLQVGRWVKNQIDSNNHPREVEYISDETLVWNVEEDQEKVRIEDEQERKEEEKKNNTLIGSDPHENKNRTLIGFNGPWHYKDRSSRATF